jgi:hypothetical protein
MWKRRSLLLLIPCLAIVIGLLMLPSREHEPQYHGQPLSHWVLLSQRAIQSDEADKAIREIGTNALPLLLKWIRYELPAWRGKLAKDNHPILQRLVGPFVTTKQEVLADARILSFRILGTNAAIAIPELAGLMRNASAPQTAFRAMGALSQIGTNGLPPLISAIQDSQYPFRVWAVTTIAFMHASPASASVTTPVLIQCLSDTTTPRIPLVAAFGLGHNDCAPQLSIPALTRCLATAGASEQLRCVAVQSLARFGALATNALPALTNALTDSSLMVRSAATNAIEKITSEVSTRTLAP